MCQGRLTNYDVDYMNNDDTREVIRTGASSWFSKQQFQCFDAIRVARPGADDRPAAAEKDDILA